METGARVLIVDDDKDFCEILSILMKRDGHMPITAHDGETALNMIRLRKPDLLLVDSKMPKMNGMEVLRKAKKLDSDLPVIIITAYAEIYAAVEAMKAGAYYYLAKPFDHHDVIQIVRHALTNLDCPKKVYQSTTNHTTFDLKEKMGSSGVICELIEQVDRVAKSDFSVLIQGETGSGKELLARAIHQASPRFNAPFVPVDCGAIPETLLESELFGHEKGAFTNADHRKSGKFEEAQHGSFFLDEISNMPLYSQAKLLRVIQDKRLYPVGSTKPVDIDVRLLSACNQDLKKLCETGKFRQDLFFRLNEFNIKVPSLRERKEDIPYLAKRFLKITNKELDKNIKGLSNQAISLMMSYPWPGNVRQLRSAIRRAALMADDVITEKHLDMLDMKAGRISALALNNRFKGMLLDNLSLKEIIKSCTVPIEREVLTEALHMTGGNKAKAARMLRIDYKTIHSKIKQYGIITN